MLKSKITLHALVSVCVDIVLRQCPINRQSGLNIFTRLRWTACANPKYGITSSA